MSITRSISEGLAPLVDLVFPPRCPLCGDAIGEQSGLCMACWATLAIPAGPACSACQRPIPDGERGEGTRCVSCLREPPRHAGIAAATLYNEPSRKLVLAFKHGGRIALAPLLAGMIASRLPPLDPDAVFVPVPLHRWRLWRRGYNQSAVLAQALASRSQKAVVVDALVRTRQTPVLGGLTREQRRAALAGAIAVRAGGRPEIAGRQVVLVDDVLTSGATTDACVRTLLDAGARSVLIACFARVLDEDLPPTSETPGV